MRAMPRRGFVSDHFCHRKIGLTKAVCNYRDPWGAHCHWYIAAMYQHEHTIRVRYGETDQMGYVYYGDYAEYLEVGRVEALRSLGFPYRRLEEEGMMLPVHDLHITYHKPARYDDLLTIRTTIPVLPSVRMKFTYELRNEAGELLCEAATTLVFVDSTTMRPMRGPDELAKALAPFFTT